MIGVFGSPTKGLLVYAPVLIAGIYAVPLAFRAHRNIVTYAALLIACALGLMSLLTSPAGDGWGCRYMHIAIAPLILCIGVAWPSFRWRRDAPLVFLAMVGVVISFLGAVYYYGARDFAMKDAGQNTLEWMNGDDIWNHVQFNARLFRVWLSQTDATPALWTPNHIWVWSPPPGAQPWKSIDLRQYCQPQSVLLRYWKIPSIGNISWALRMYEVFLLAGLLLLGWVIARTSREAKLAAANQLGTV